MSEAIDAHLKWLKGEHYAESTLRDRRKLLLYADRHLPRGLEDVYDHEISDFIFNPRWSDWTQHTYASGLRRFYWWAERVGWLTCNPMADIKPPRSGQARPKPVSIADLRKALAESPEPWLTAIVLATFAGLRAAEIADIRREDISEEYVHVRRGKGGKGRYVETSAVLWRHIRSRPAGPLVVRKYGRGPVTASWLSCTQQRHWRAIGLPHFHLHRLRHSFCTYMLGAGHDSLVIRDLMGHSSVLTTQGYAEIAANAKRAAVESLDRLLGEHRPD